MGPGRFLAQLFHRFLVYNFSPAGWFFFAGGSHFVGIFGPNFWYHFWSQFLAPGCPQIQGLLFNLKFLVPVLGTRFGPQTWDQKPYSFLFQTPVTFQPNFEQSLHLTQKMGTKSVLVLGTCVHPKRFVTFRCLRFLGSVLVLTLRTCSAQAAAPRCQNRERKKVYHWGRCLRMFMQRHARVVFLQAAQRKLN